MSHYLANFMSFETIEIWRGMLELTSEQKKKLLKAKDAVALQNELGRVPILGNQKLCCLGLK